MHPDLLTVEIIAHGESVTLRLAGEIDLESAPTVRAAALAAIRRHSAVIRLDLAEVGFMDSTGLEMLLATQRRVALNGGQLLLVSPSRPVLRVLEVTGVDRFFTIEAAPDAQAASAL
jgi:anti-sigma B factor antagonist